MSWLQNFSLFSLYMGKSTQSVSGHAPRIMFMASWA